MSTQGTTRNGTGQAAIDMTMWQELLGDMGRGWASLFQLAPNVLTQPINPGWNLGVMMNVTHNNSSAPDTERAVLERHSYGRQLGRMMDVLQLLLDAAPKLKSSDEAKDFDAMRREIAEIKRDARRHRFQGLARELEALRAEDPQSFEQVSRELRRLLGG
jgi:hypothetical protein